MTKGSMDRYCIEAARSDELGLLRTLEDEAGRLFGTLGLDPDMPGLEEAELREGFASGTLWVARVEDGTPVGFALAWPRPGALHLREMDVLPSHGRRGLGARLLTRVAEAALARGVPRVTLTTFETVPWNAPYYARHGFRRWPEAQWPDWLRAIRREESEHGLDRWPRMAMTRVLDAGS